MLKCENFDIPYTLMRVFSSEFGKFLPKFFPLNWREIPVLLDM